MTSKRSGYAKGEKRVREILDAAEHILIESGYHNFSLRKVSTQAGISVGNLQYYFANKEKLVGELINRTISDYLLELDEIRHHGSLKEQFAKAIEQLMHDLKLKRTTRLFTELWTLANHEQKINIMVDDMYEKYRSKLSVLIMDINPNLSPMQAKRLSIFIISSIEGHFVFIGYDKKWTGESDSIITMAVNSFLLLIESGDIPNK